MALYNRKKLDTDLNDLDRLDQEITVAIAIGEPDYFWEAAGRWLLELPGFDPNGRDKSGNANWSGRIWFELKSLKRNSGVAWAPLATKWLDSLRQRFRMKLVNAGQLIDDLLAAKAEMATAENTGVKVEQAQDRLDEAFQKLRWNSDGVKAPRDDAPEPPPEALEGSERREVDLDDPEGQETLKTALRLGKRVLWRPHGKEIAWIFRD